MTPHVLADAGGLSAHRAKVHGQPAIKVLHNLEHRRKAEDQIKKCITR